MLIAVVVVVVWFNLVAVCNESTSGGTTKGTQSIFVGTRRDFPVSAFPERRTTVSVPSHGRRNAQL